MKEVCFVERGVSATLHLYRSINTIISSAMPNRSSEYVANTSSKRVNSRGRNDVKIFTRSLNFNATLPSEEEKNDRAKKSIQRSVSISFLRGFESSERRKEKKRKKKKRDAKNLTRCLNHYSLLTLPQ